MNLSTYNKFFNIDKFFTTQRLLFGDSTVFTIYIEEKEKFLLRKNWGQFKIPLWVVTKLLTSEKFNQKDVLGPLFLCWFSGVVPFKMWLILGWEENKCYKLSNYLTKWQLFSLKMTTSAILCEIDVILCICSSCNNIYFLISLRSVTC